MTMLKYDVVTALQCGYSGKPYKVMKEQGYSWLSVINKKTSTSMKWKASCTHSTLPGGF